MCVKGGLVPHARGVWLVSSKNAPNDLAPRCKRTKRPGTFLRYYLRMELDELLESLRSYPGLTRKRSIGGWANRFSVMSGQAVLEHGPGDDAGAVPSGDGYLLLAGEGMMTELLQDPEFAGFCSVTVNVNDIYAMGGRPVGLVTIVFVQGIDDTDRGLFTAGMAKALEHYELPLLGGHTTPDAGPAVAVCVAGFAHRLLRGDTARPGDWLVAALDLTGSPHEPFHAWDSVSGSTGESTLNKLEALVELSERGLASACRDISNPGILGTLAMMLESSEAGAVVDLDAIPVPEGVDLDWWLKAYPSYGFLLSAHPTGVEEVAAVLQGRGVTCARIGRVTEGSRIEASWAGHSGLFLDWKATPVTGL